VGWSKDEFEAVGVPYGERGKRGDEFIECLKAIWTQEVVESRGRFYTVPRSKIGPKPIQKPHPPITVGGYGPAAVRRAVALADGFMGGNVPLDQVAPLVNEMKDPPPRIEGYVSAARLAPGGKPAAPLGNPG
jgi:alkanesulfonate monooxygenase SsuD/methylene tetrahydromethanopterin reductase-like flavin-dependent oxidoreductase (luciferase family)